MNLRVNRDDAWFSIDTGNGGETSIQSESELEEFLELASHAADLLGWSPKPPAQQPPRLATKKGKRI